MLRLATALGEAGHAVAVATGPEFRARAERAGFTTFDCGIQVGAAFGRLAERYPEQEYNRLEPSQILGWYLPHLFAETLAPALLTDLEPIVSRWRPTSWSTTARSSRDPGPAGAVPLVESIAGAR